MTILNSLYELLYGHDCVIIPGLGGFVANYRPASIHPVLHTFSPPSKDLLFNPRLTVNDGLLLSHIAQREGISYEIASQRLSGEVQQSLLQLDRGASIEIARVGTLSRDADGVLQFKPAGTLNFLPGSFGLSSFIAPVMVREHDALQNLLTSAGNDGKIRPLPIVLKRSLTIGIPAAAMIALAFLAIGPLDEWMPQTSNLFPWNKQATPQVTEAPAAERPMAKTFRADLFSFQPRIADTAVLEVQTTPAANGAFCLIGGCFSVEDNAANFTRGLQAEGYVNASYFKQENASLYKVCFSRHATLEAAQQAQQQLRNKHPEAWILSM